MKNRVVLLILTLISISGFTALFASHTSALSNNTPEDVGTGTPFYNLRYHDSGLTLGTPLAMYSKEGANRPNNATFTVIERGSDGCKPSSSDRGIRLRIQVNGGNVYNQLLQNDTCEKNRGSGKVYRTYTIANSAWSLDENGRYKVDLNIFMSGGSHGKDYYNTGERRARFQFSVRTSSNVLITNRANSISSRDYQTNYGVAGSTLYRVDFAAPCTDENPARTTVGMWDPDGFKNEIRIERQLRTGGGWSAMSFDRAYWVNIDRKSSDGYYITQGGDGENVGFRFTPERKYFYRLSLRTVPDNHVSLFWPYNSINADVDCGYRLNPVAANISPVSVDPGSQVMLNNFVIKSGSTQSDATKLRVTKVVYPNTININDIDNKQIGSIGELVGNTNDGPCAAVKVVKNWQIPQGSCDEAWGEIKNNEIFTTSSTAVNRTFDVPNEIGKRVCFVVSVSEPVDNQQRKSVVATAPYLSWNHSIMECMIISKNPKVQILGSDLRVVGSSIAGSGKILTSVSNNILGATYGSWGEYGVLSKGLNDTASSGAGLRGGNPSNTASSWSNLTFTNNTNSLGEYEGLKAADTKSYFASLAQTSSTQPNSGAIDSGVYDLPAGTTLGNIDLGKNKSVILRSSGTITISGDIKIPTDYSGITELSQLVIVADRIVIADNVTQVDAWLIATNNTNSGAVLTCGNREINAVLRMSVADCTLPLTVNGPVITDKLHLVRTAGAGFTDPGTAAEVFNLRPSSYIWAYNYTNRQTRAQTTYLKELPPRY